LDEWAFKNRVKLLFIEPGKPVQNAVIESFNGKMREESLNQEWLCGLDEARAGIERWREDYNQCRPHSALDNLAPAVWAQRQLTENLYSPAK
jgi:putative transposase